MIEVTSAIKEVSMAVNPHFITAITRPDEGDPDNVGCWLHFQGLEEEALAVQESYNSMLNQVSNALAFSIVSRKE